MYVIVEGDLLEQQVECYVNAWNMNYIPFFLLLPHGVAGRLRQAAGWSPFWQLWRRGILSPGEAMLTSGGKLKAQIIHAAGLQWYWVSSEKIVEDCTRNALLLAEQSKITSIAFPLLGSGVGGLKPEVSQRVMEKVFNEKNWKLQIVLVKYKKL